VLISTSGVQFPIVNTYPSLGSNSYGNELIFIVLSHGDNGLFRNNLDGTHPLIIQDGLDNIVIQPP